MSRLVHAGSAVVDHVYRIDMLPLPGAEKTAASYDRVAGGGFNMMVAARRTGMPVVFAGRHGTGPNGDFLRAAFATECIEVLTPPAPELDSGNCVVMVSADAERTFVSWPGAEATLRAADLAAAFLEAGDWVFTSGYTLSYPGSRDALASWIEALSPEIPFVFDPTPVVSEIPKDILARVLARTSWLSCNAAEAAAITGTADVATGAELLLSRHCPHAAGLVVRTGEAGAHVLLRDGRSQTIPGFKVAAVDTNGAGDTHIGAFVSALARGESSFAAARYANAAAAISVTRRGGSSAPTDAEINDFLAAMRPSEETDQDRRKITA
jgi:sugar/nucleoside kinase (ribokinase family)